MWQEMYVIDVLESLWQSLKIQRCQMIAEEWRYTLLIDTGCNTNVIQNLFFNIFSACPTRILLIANLQKA